MGAIADSIVAYAQPLIDSTDGSMEQLNKALAIGQVCWNLAITPEDQRQSVLEEMRNSFPMGEAEFDDFERSVLLPMIRRHEEMFPRLHQRHSLEPPHRQPMLSPPMTKAATEKPQPGRYDPCPCNSGKKYKFCCGQRRV